MPDIYCDFGIRASLDKVFAAVSTPQGLDQWWTKTCKGKAEQGAEFKLGFGPGYDWHAKVSKCRPCSEFELEIEEADADWNGTRVGFRLESKRERTGVQFYHTGWPTLNEHYRISCYCWASYLRLLRRNLEYGEYVPYEERDNA